MPYFSPHVFRNSTVKAYRLCVENHPYALQGSLRFQAYGGLLVNALLIRFFGPDGSPIHEIRPYPEAPVENPLLGRVRRLPFALRFEYLLRQVLRRTTMIHLDVPPHCLAHGSISVAIQNVGGYPVAVGEMALHTSILDPGRSVQNLHMIEGYSERISVRAGEALRLFIHAPLLRFALTVARHGAHDETVFSLGEIAGKPQDYAADAYERGAGWDPGFTLQVAADWRPGMYVARLSDNSGSSFDITFIVKPAESRAKSGALAVLASTNTWQAYNSWGGASLYRYDLDDGLRKTEACLLHAQRPNPAATMAGTDGHLANAERHILNWLERNGFTYDLYADQDLHDDPALLLQYQTLLINTHSEYWTEPMYVGLEHFLGRGGNLVYLSGNGLYWKTVIRGQQMEVRADHGNHSFSDEAGGRWRDFGRRESRLLGVRFTHAGYKSGYKPYKVLAPWHWVFEGTGLARGDLIGKEGLNLGGASGLELDKIDPRHKPAGLVHLAKGTNGWRCGADMTYFTHAGGGGVFAVGSITFGGSLAVDPVLGQMVRNVLHRFSNEPAAGLRGTTGLNALAATDFPYAPGNPGVPVTPD